MSARLRPSSSKSRETRACFCQSGTRNQASETSSVRTKSHESSTCLCPTRRRNQSGGTSSIRCEVTQKESLSSFVRYEESCRRNFIHLVQSHEKGELVLVCLVRGIKQEGLCSSGSILHETRASPRPFGRRNQASKTLSIRYEVARGDLDHVRPVR